MAIGGDRLRQQLQCAIQYRTHLRYSCRAPAGAIEVSPRLLTQRCAPGRRAIAGRASSRARRIDGWSPPSLAGRGRAGRQVREKRDSASLRSPSGYRTRRPRVHRPVARRQGSSTTPAASRANALQQHLLHGRGRSTSRALPRRGAVPRARDSSLRPSANAASKAIVMTACLFLLIHGTTPVD